MATLTVNPDNSVRTAKAVPQPLWLVRTLPSLTDLAFLLPLLCVFVLLGGPSGLLGDGDTGWHIRTGEWILAHGRVPVADMFSFTKPGQPWFAWEWGWDVVAALIHRSWGMAGLLGWNIVLLCFVSALLFRLVRRACHNDVLAMAVTTAAIVGSIIHWVARPHLASWILLLVFCHVIQSGKEGKWRVFWCLPLLTVLWANIHGSFFVGIAMLFFASADRLMARDKRAARAFASCGLMCSLLTLVNPYGWDLHKHVIAYLRDSKQLENVGEFRSLSFHHPLAIFLELFIVLGAICLPRFLKRKRFADALWLVLWMHLALGAGRNIPLYLFFAAPAIAEMIQRCAETDWAMSAAEALRKFGRFVSTAGQDFRLLEAVPRIHLVSIGAVAALAILMTHPRGSTALKAEYDPSRYPVLAAKTLQDAGISKVFTSDDWGGYLIYRLYPRCRVFVDGRSDFYGASLDSRALNVINARYNWKADLDGFGIDAILLAVESPLSSVLKNSNIWKPAFDDGVAIVFLKRPSAPGLPDKTKFSSASPGGGKGSAMRAARGSAVTGIGSKTLERRSS